MQGTKPTEEAKKETKQPKKKSPNPKPEYDDYLAFLHKRKVEVHIAYGNNIIKLQGILRAKARFDIQLILDEKNKDIITINKGYIVMVKPL